MSLHDALLDLLLDVADVALVTSYAGEGVGLGDPDDLRVFLGDMHLISAARQAEKDYAYGLNHEPLLVDLVRGLGRLRSAARTEDRRVVLYQNGDFLDLWRETPTVAGIAEAAARIADDHAPLVDALADAGASMLLGNHDFDMYRLPDARGHARRYHVGLPDGPPRVFVTHGDVFEVDDVYPAFLKQLAVYLFSPVEQAPTYEVGAMAELDRQLRQGQTFQASLRTGPPPDVGRLLPLGAGQVPSRYNVQVEGAIGAGTQYLDAARRVCAQAPDGAGATLRTVVVGHTHHPRIAIAAPGAPQFTLVDCGAWIECNLSDGRTIVNAEVAALCGDEARVYHLAPKGAVA